MNGIGKTGQPGPKRWLGVGLRLLVTLFFLLLIVLLNRCSLTTSPQVETPAAAPSAGNVTVMSAEPTPEQTPSIPTVTLIPTQTREPARPLPDLAIQQIRIELETGGACDFVSTALGVRVWIENAGPGDAGPFAVSVNGAQQVVSDGLATGQTASLWFEGYSQGGANVIVVDATSQVEESDEHNNTLSERAPIPTLPPTCTPPPQLPPTDTPTPPPPPAAAVSVQEGQVTIPTYPYANLLTRVWSETPAGNVAYDVLDRTAYDASNPAPRDVAYRTLVVENRYLKLTFLPDLGGRLYEIIFKPTGHRETYRNPVLKPSPWGPPEQGWWLAAGGIEWCLPVEEHGYEWGIPWKLTVGRDAGSATITLTDTEAQDRIRAQIVVRLEAEAGYFTIRPRLQNPTGAPLAVKYWTNAMLAPGGRNVPSSGLRFVLPDAVTAVTVHSRGDDFLPGYNERMSWPVSNGVDLSRLGNWNRWLGFFEDPAAGEFMAIYDESYDEGMVRVFPADVVAGAKGFAFGWGDPIPASNWTDDGSSYVEIHGGPAPTFDDSVTIPAGGHLEWTETWYPVSGMGGLRYANDTAALNLTGGGGSAQIAMAVSRPWSGDVVLLLNGQERWRQGTSLVPGQPFRNTVPLGSDAPQSGRLTLRLEAPNGAVAAEYSAGF